MNFDELVFFDESPRHAAFGGEGGDEGGDDDEPGIEHEPGDFRNTADVFDAVGFGETQVFRKTVTDVVAIEQVGVVAQRVEPFFDEIGNGGFARTG